MKNLKFNKKGQFTIIAALLVAVVLVGAVMTTYSSIRYSTLQEQPQMLSAIDEVNLALKKILGFTVGYYGSVLQVTGNTSYAKILASRYLSSGLDNIADIRPEWAPSFNVINLDLRTNWFTNTSYSSGNFTIKYSLGGIGVKDMTYSASSRLDAQILGSSAIGQAKLNVTSDFEPLVDLGQSSFRFYKYIFSNSTWEFVLSSSEPITYMNGIYLIDLPSGMNSSYVVEIEDTRGLMVVASAFSQFASTIAWNTTSVEQGFDYVDYASLNLTGTHSNFAAQQNGPDSNFDILTEGALGFVNSNYYPLFGSLLGSTTVAYSSGNITADLCSDNGGYLQLQSYASAFGAPTTFGYSTQGETQIALSNIKGSRFTCTSTGVANSISAYLRFTPSNGNLGNTNTGSSGQSIADTIRGQRFASPSSPVVAQNINAYLDVTGPTFGNTIQESSSSLGSIENYIRGSSFTATQSGTIQNISAYIQCSNIAKNMSAAIYNENTHSYIAQTAQKSVPVGTTWVTFNFDTPPSVTAGNNYVLVVWSASGNGNAYLYYTTSGGANQGHRQSQTYASSWPSPLSGSSLHNNYRYSIYAEYTPQSRNVKAAIYDSSSNLVNSTQAVSVSADGWVTFNFDSPPTLAASTNYILVVWAQSGSGSVTLCYSSSSGGNGRYANGQAYGNWPSTLSLSTDAYQYSIYCSYSTRFRAQAAIYSSDGITRIGITEEKTLGTTDGFVSFNFITQPALTSGTNYVLAIWSDNSNVNVYYTTGSARRFESSGSPSYPSWPSTIDDQGASRTYSIYCTYLPVSQFTAAVEFTGASDMNNWQQLNWIVDSAVTIGTASYTFELFNYSTGQYQTSGDGYMTGSLTTTDSMKIQNIAVNPANFRDGAGNWKLRLTAVNTTSSQFDLKIDLSQFSPQVTNYALDLREEWVNVDSANKRQDLCIKTGAFTSESLMLEIYAAGSWQNVLTLAPNAFNNISLVPYINSATLTIRFTSSNQVTDPTQDSWNIDAVFIKPQPDIDYLIKLQDSTFTVEVLQNGTMRWLGQNLQLTTQELPIPPVPVKAIHVNQTFVNGTNKEVPFQIEDWASEYRIPLGLTSNQTVFSNRQMIVFLADNKVTEFTIWWDGSDAAVQTPLAYTNFYFHDSTNSYNNGRITLSITDAGAFTITSQVVGKSTSSTTNFMRINNEASTYGAGSANVICNGTVRDIIQQEAEWNGGADNCPNVYANIVLTLPAGVSYYTYQLRFMFINSTQARTISDLSPIRVSTSFTPTQAETENGTLAGFPIIQNGTGIFYNYTGGNWSAHHWSQLITGTGQGAGIMFSESNNQKLYFFDSIAPSQTGSLSIDLANKLIELKPVNLTQVTPFKTALDISWSGAVATFDNTTPICKMYDVSTPTGLWILAEYPPTLTVTAKS